MELYTLSLRFCIESSTGLCSVECQHLNKIDSDASAGHYKPHTYYYVGLRGPGKTEAEGQKVLGPSMVIRRQTTTI